MPRFIVVFCIFMMLMAGGTFAQIESGENGGEMAQTIVDTLTLLFLLIGTYVAMELYNLMKGGQLASSWGFMAGGVIIFAVITIIEVAGRAEYFVVPQVLISVGHLFVALFLLLGFMRQRKALR